MHLVRQIYNKAPLPPLGSAAGAAAGAEAGAEAGAVVEARTATEGSISTTYATTTVARRGLGEVTADTLSPRGKRGEVKNPPLPKMSKARAASVGLSRNA